MISSLLIHETTEQLQACHDSAVEVNCIITKEGPKPIAVGDLPVPVRGLVQQIKSFERTTIEAAVTGDYHKALLAMTINPLVPSDKVAKQILDEMLEAHKEHLPQFFKKGREIKRRYLARFFLFYPTLMGSKTPTSKFSESKEIRWGDQLPIKVRLVQLIISGGEETPH